jgi:hypothetical protein
MTRRREKSWEVPHMKRLALLPLVLGTLATCLVFLSDTAASPGFTERVSVDSLGSQGNGYSVYPAISADGRYVAFNSGASNLVSGDTNGAWDVFVHDRGAVAVGGIAELPDIARRSVGETDTASQGPGRLLRSYAVLAGGLGAGVVTMAAGIWYARRRRLRQRS